METKRGSEAFRALLDGPGLVPLPGCFDVLSAVVLERAGFPAVFVSGFGVSASLLGSPDIGLTTLAETLDVARRVVDQVQIPVVLDLDNGYGDVDNTVRAVRGAEAAGVAAIQLEDQILPKRCGHAAGKQVCDVDTYLRKLEAALEARRQGLVVIARTDSSDLDDAIHRVQRYRAAGADVTIVDGLQSEAAAQRVVSEVPGPMQLNLILGGKTPPLSADMVERMGFKILLYSTPLLFCATQAMVNAAEVLKASGDLTQLAPMGIGYEEFHRLIDGHYQRSRPPSLRPAAAGEGETEPVHIPENPVPRF